MYVQRNSEARTWNNCLGKAISLTYFCVCVRVDQCTHMCVSVGARARDCACARVTLLTSMQHLCAIFSTASMATPYNLTLSRKGQNSWKKVSEHEICVLNFSTTFTWNISHCKKNSERLNVKKSSCMIFLIKISFYWYSIGIHPDAYFLITATSPQGLFLLPSSGGYDIQKVLLS